MSPKIILFLFLLLISCVSCRFRKEVAHFTHVEKETGYVLKTKRVGFITPKRHIYRDWTIAHDSTANEKKWKSMELINYCTGWHTMLKCKYWDYVNGKWVRQTCKSFVSPIQGKYKKD